MNYLLANSKLFGFSINSILLRNRQQYYFSSYPSDIGVQKQIQFQFKFRTLVRLADLADYINQNKEDIQNYAKTSFLQAINQYPIQGYRRQRDQLNQTVKQQKSKNRLFIFNFIMGLQNLRFYEQNIRLSVIYKFSLYVPDLKTEAVTKFIEQTRNKLVQQLQDQNQKLDIIDAVNWLYILPINYPRRQAVVAFQKIQKWLTNSQRLQYLQNQRCIPVFIKRAQQIDWGDLRRFPKILNFLTYHAKIKDFENLQELITILERLLSIGIHLFGDKTISKLIDTGLSQFQQNFQRICKNKYIIMRLFGLWKHLPIHFNKPFFNKIHNYLKSQKQLPTHLLLHIPYNKLSQKQIQFLQSKLFTFGRQDIVSKLIYSIYLPDFKHLMTPLLMKQAYLNLLQVWRKKTYKIQNYYQFFIATIFRLLQIKNPPIKIDRNQLRNIFKDLVQDIHGLNLTPLHSFSMANLITFFQLLHNLNIQKRCYERVLKIFQQRKKTVHQIVNNQNIMIALRPHFNASSQDSKKMMAVMMKHLINSPDTLYGQRCEILFLIEKAKNPNKEWKQISNQIKKQIIKDPQLLAQTYLKYPYHTLKLSNFIYELLYQSKVQFSIIIQMISGLNTKLLTSLKGKLLTPLKKYLKDFQTQRFNIEQVSLKSIFLTYMNLFYFRSQIQQFMQFFSIKIIQKVHSMNQKDQIVANMGVPFVLTCNYLMQTIQNFSSNQKAQIIQKILKIIKSYRKKQGLFLKVLQFDFICTHKKFLKINKQVLQIQFSQILTVLKKSQNIAQYKHIFFIVLKLHCLEFVQLSASDLKYFRSIVSTLIDSNSIQLTKIKDLLGYNILHIQEQSQIQKIKIILSDFVKLAFRRQNRKVNFFIYEYFLQFFSKIQQKQLIIQICQNVLYNKLYPIEVSTLLPILSQNQIKSKKFTERIVDIMILANAYTSFEKTQVISWLQKTYYKLQLKNVNIITLKQKVEEEIQTKVIQMQKDYKNRLQKQQRSRQDGFQITDLKQVTQNIKNFIEYAWISIKNNATQTKTFKFICRFLFFNIQNIKQLLQNNTSNRQQISKIKLFHILKYVKDKQFFHPQKKFNLIGKQNQKKVFMNPKQKKIYQSNLKKYKLLCKLEQNLNCFRIQRSGKLQNVLQNYKDNITWTFMSKDKGSSQNQKKFQIQYLIKQNTSSSKQSAQQYVIHTVKKYHEAIQIQTQQKISQVKTQQNKTKQIQVQIDQNNLKSYDEQHEKLSSYKVQIQYGQYEQALETQTGTQNQPKKYFKIQEADLSDNIKPDRMFPPVIKKKPEKPVRQEKQTPQKKPLFGSKKSSLTSLQTDQNTAASNSKDISSKQKIRQNLKQTTKLKTVLPLQKNPQEIYKNYNGYLKIQKELIEESTNKKCVIYDPKLNIFFV